MRKISLVVFGLLAALLSNPNAVRGADTVRRFDTATWEVTEQSRTAALRALEYLKQNQRPDGGWTCDIGYKRDTSYQVTVEKGDHVGVTALAGTAFLSGGHLPGRGKYGKTVSRALDNILGHVGEDGYISSGGALGTRMYSHAFATLFLAEIYGMSPRSDVRVKLQRSVDFTVRCQNSQGGWRYLPFDMFSDMSVTVCQIMALRAARNVGIRVPRENIDRAVSYVVKSSVTDPNSRYEYGSFRYIIHDERQSRTSFSLTAAGLTTLYGAGIYNDADLARYVRRLDGSLPVPSFDASVAHLLKAYVDRRRLPRNHYFFFYGNYYAVQALFFRGGADWREYYPKVREELIARQLPSGAWKCSGGALDPFAAAVGAIILQVPYRYLPILQR